MINYIYTWRHKDGSVLKGFITHLNNEQVVKDEFKMTMEMLRKGYSFVRRKRFFDPSRSPCSGDWRIIGSSRQIRDNHSGEEMKGGGG